MEKFDEGIGVIPSESIPIGDRSEGLPTHLARTNERIAWDGRPSMANRDFRLSGDQKGLRALGLNNSGLRILTFRVLGLRVKQFGI